ncbi:flagellar basal body P-ring formation chaperone FlgA [Vibrio sagamiensis]|uniref:Flagella basal body P-ring formation protein FlgA n=1 Tax=Vibrio sagamiensis NBRC 104589 TaxID=1219064 RepID=A0A511QK40_9VIBR|nr:flagellar basal body P-ring formation chaperone FlgA [Vibrio sagamiensis]PNQ55603.1 flagella basal body P-ring formation protein FlgA [Vibrio agarivorans]GEM76832.1 flagella basal body P-ring formation protein FlgA [Vibrio sagamiensis NBRC 104589]
MALDYFDFTLYPINKSRQVFTKPVSIIGIFIALFSSFVYSASENQLNEIKTAAEQHILNTVEQPLGGSLSVRAAKIDSRIKATDCLEGLITSASSTSSTRSNINVLVECPADNWKVYVPVRISASVPMIVATRPLARGDIIQSSDVVISMIELQRFRKDGFSTDTQVIGAKLKRNVRLGDVVERNDVCVVCRNEKVTIRATKGSMTITTQGTALQDGSSGEQVRVKNDKSQRIIEGTVTGIAEITITF